MAPSTDASDERERETGDDEREDSHLDGVEPGSGCTEIWEHLSERRPEAASDDVSASEESADEA